MLEAVRKHLFSRRYRLLRSGEPVAELVLSKLRTRADLEVGGGRYRFYREGLFRGSFRLERGDRVVGGAEKPKLLRSRFVVRMAGREFGLEKRSAWSRTFVVREDGREVGRLHRRGFLVRRVQLELPAEWPVPAQVFVLWLALLVWNREDAAAAGS